MPFLWLFLFPNVGIGSPLKSAYDRLMLRAYKNPIIINEKVLLTVGPRDHRKCGNDMRHYVNNMYDKID
jgi:hypothetical protein